MIYGQFVSAGGRYAAWDHPHKAVNVRCPDGARRTIRLNLDADSYASWPSRAHIRGRSVRGFVTGCETDGQRDLEFIPYDHA